MAFPSTALLEINQARMVLLPMVLAASHPSLTLMASQQQSAALPHSTKTWTIILVILLSKTLAMNQISGVLSQVSTISLHLGTTDIDTPLRPIASRWFPIKFLQHCWQCERYHQIHLLVANQAQILSSIKQKVTEKLVKGATVFVNTAEKVGLQHTTNQVPKDSLSD